MGHIYSKNTRFYLMGIATIFILLLHAHSYAIGSSANLHKIIVYFFKNGAIGVNLFYLLSAYGLCYSYQNNHTKSYYFKRFKRLMPMLLIYCIFHFILYDDFIFPISLWNVVAHITGISVFFNDNLLDWFIPTLIFIYIIFPFLFRFCVLLKKFGLAFVFVLLTLYLLCMIPVYDFDWQLKLPRLCTVIIGILTYLYEQEGQLKKIYALYGWAALMSYMSFVEGAYLAVPAIALLISKSENHLPCYKIISFVGRHSLEIYLAQALCLWKLNYTNYYWFLITMFISVVIIAFILWSFQNYFWKLIDTIN